MRKEIYLSLSVFGFLLIAACSKDVGPKVEETTDPAGSGEGLTLSVFNGDGQVALAGAILYDTLKVQLVDENEAPVAGRQIEFKAELSGTTLFTTEATTDKHGIAWSRVAIGDLQPGTHQAVSAFLKSDADISADFSVKIVAETEVDTWLRTHARIAEAIRWPGATTLAYKDWNTTQRTALYHYYQQAKADWQRKVPTPRLPENQYTGTSFLMELSERDAWTIYLSNIAVSLHLEIDNLLGWSLLDYDESELQMLLDGSTFFLANSNSGGYQLNTPHISRYVLPESAMFLRSFLQEQDCIQSDRLSTIVALLEWCHHNLDHFSGRIEKENFYTHWQYHGATPISRMINGTTRTSDSRFGRYTAGCHGTADFLKIILRSVNIPVVSMWGLDGSGHRQVWFMTEGLYMAHGDDPYNGHTWVTPAVSMGEFLVDKSTMEEWFTGPVTESVARGVAGLAVKHLSNILVNLRAEEPVGTPPAESKILERMSTYFTLEELLEMDLWDRLDAKIESLGGRDRIPEVLIGRYR